MARDVIDEVLFGGTAKAAGSETAGSRPAMSGIAWAVGLALLAAAVYALASTGKFSGMWNKMKRGASEMTGGMMGKKPDDKDDK